MRRILLSTVLTVWTLAAQAEGLKNDYFYPGVGQAIKKDTLAQNTGFTLPKSAPVPPAEAEAPRKEFYRYSLDVGGFSRHNTRGKPNTMHEQNFMLGGRISADFTVLGGRPFVQYDHVFVNSKKGSTDLLGVGAEWTLIRGEKVDLCGSLTATRIRYHDAVRDKVAYGNAVIPGLCLRYDRFKLNFTALGKDIVFMHLNIGF